MSTPAIEAIEQKLDETLAKLKECTEPSVRRSLLAEMRGLISDLDRLVYPPNSLRSDQ